MKFEYKVYVHKRDTGYTSIYIGVKEKDPYILTKDFLLNNYTAYDDTCDERNFSHIASQLECVIYGLPYGP